MLRYGVFQRGTRWCVASSDGADLYFPDRDRAMAAAGMILDLHRACGEVAELLAQDEFGRLRTLVDPRAEAPQVINVAVGYAHLRRMTPPSAPYLRLVK